MPKLVLALSEDGLGLKSPSILRPKDDFITVEVNPEDGPDEIFTAVQTALDEAAKNLPICPTVGLPSNLHRVAHIRIQPANFELRKLIGAELHERLRSSIGTFDISDIGANHLRVSLKLPYKVSPETASPPLDAGSTALA